MALTGYISHVASGHETIGSRDKPIAMQEAFAQMLRIIYLRYTQRTNITMVKISFRYTLGVFKSSRLPGEALPTSSKSERHTIVRVRHIVVVRIAVVVHIAGVVTITGVSTTEPPITKMSRF
jgi:hypothetical protein